VAQNVLVSGQDAARWGNAHPNLCPYQLFDAADRPMVIAVGSDPQWLACATALGLEALAADPALRSNAGRVTQRDRVVRAVAERCHSAPAAHWLAALDAAGVPCGVVRPVREALEHFGLQPLPGGRVRRGPPALDADGPAIRRNGWSALRSDP
jgi:crotonobetainyl-CoA:carnitine CoA-transferase CaiB-like acyl-CoA transferase